jgi:hypothetical protein
MLILYDIKHGNFNIKIHKCDIGYSLLVESVNMKFNRTDIYDILVSKTKIVFCVDAGCVQYTEILLLPKKIIINIKTTYTDNMASCREIQEIIDDEGVGDCCTIEFF